MKKTTFIFATFLFLLVTDIFGVNKTDTLPLTDSAAVGLIYKKKAKTELVTGIVLSSAGAIAAGVGLALAASELENLGHIFEPGYRGKDYGSLPEILGYGGLVLIAASVPLYIVSGKHKRKARLYLKYQRPASHLPVSLVKRQISATVAIRF